MPASVDTLRALRTGSVTTGPLPEMLCERRKMTAWLPRSGHPHLSKHTVDRLVRAEGMHGLIRCRKFRTTIAGKDGVRAGDRLNRGSVPADRIGPGSPTSSMSRPGPGSPTSPSLSTSIRGRSSAGQPRLSRMSPSSRRTFDGPLASRFYRSTGTYNDDPPLRCRSQHTVHPIHLTLAARAIGDPLRP